MVAWNHEVGLKCIVIGAELVSGCSDPYNDPLALFAGEDGPVHGPPLRDRTSALRCFTRPGLELY